jgi:hypothetical protein
MRPMRKTLSVAVSMFVGVMSAHHAAATIARPSNGCN